MPNSSLIYFGETLTFRANQTPEVTESRNFAQLNSRRSENSSCRGQIEVENEENFSFSKVNFHLLLFGIFPLLHRVPFLGEFAVKWSRCHKFPLSSLLLPLKIAKLWLVAPARAEKFNWACKKWWTFTAFLYFSIRRSLSLFLHYVLLFLLTASIADTERWSNERQRCR